MGAAGWRCRRLATPGATPHVDMGRLRPPVPFDGPTPCGFEGRPPRTFVPASGPTTSRRRSGRAGPARPRRPARRLRAGLRPVRRGSLEARSPGASADRRDRRRRCRSRGRRPGRGAGDEGKGERPARRGRRSQAQSPRPPPASLKGRARVADVVSNGIERRPEPRRGRRGARPSSAKRSGPMRWTAANDGCASKPSSLSLSSAPSASAKRRPGRPRPRFALLRPAPARSREAPPDRTGSL